MPFINTHTHLALGSNLRIRDSINKIEEIIPYSHELGHKGIVITEHESITSHLDCLDYFNKIQNSDDYSNYRLGLGNEIYLCSENCTAENFKTNIYPHFILIALDTEGHQAIRELSTKAWTENAFMSVMMRVPTYYHDLESLMTKYQEHLIGQSACFVAGTQVETREGWKNIEQITSQDYVYNMYGEWEKVNYPTHRFYTGKGYQFTFTGSERPLICTEDHKLLVTSANKIHKNTSPEYVKAKDLKILSQNASKHICLQPIKEYNYTALPYIKASEYKYKLYKNTGLRKVCLPDIIYITSEFMRMIGYFIGNGSISIKQNKVICFTLNQRDFDTCYINIFKPLEEQLHINWSIMHRPEQSRVDITGGGLDFVELIYYLFGDIIANIKHIPDRIRINKELDYELIYGYYLADGYSRVRNFHKDNKYQTGEVVFDTVSKKLKEQLYDILDSMKLLPSITAKESYYDNNMTHHQKSYYIIISGKILGSLKKDIVYSHNEIINIFKSAEKNSNYIEYKNKIYRKVYIKNRQEITLNQEVYCLNNDTHSFKCENIIVHNCIGGTLPRYLLNYKQTGDEAWLNKSIDWINYMNELFGQGYFFLEMQPGESEEQKYVNNKLLELSNLTHTDYLISTDAHYARKEDRDIHRTFLNAQDADREVDEFYATTYVMSEEEIHNYMDEYLGSQMVQVGIDNTMKVYDKLTDYDLKKSLHIPYIPIKAKEPDERLYAKYKDKVPLYQYLHDSKYDSDRHLLTRLLEYMETDEWYRNDLAYEKINEALDYLIRSSDKNNVRWSAYLLQMADYIDICWETGSVVGAGRGSGVGFCLLHMLGITQICPWRETTKTYPARFLNPDRVSVLDIDTDINPIYRDKIIDRMKDIYGVDRVSKVLTIQTEKSRSAIQTAGRGIGLDNDLTAYIASLIIFDRGIPRSLQTMYYGNDEFPPVPEFVREMDAHPDLWIAAQKIEGLCCGAGSHAGGVIIADEPLTDSTALMRTNSGDIITQFDLHKCEDVSLIKIDLLATDAVGKIQECLNLLLNAHKIEWQGTLKDTYEKYIGIYTLERDAEDMWKLLWDHKVLSFFQMEKESGKQALALVKPKSVDDLATINSVIRLMPEDKGAETPLQKYARFHDNVQLWYDEMTEAGLTQEEQDVIKEFLGVSSGICEAQEYLMFMSMHPMIGGFDLNWADSLRKAVGKKSVKDFDRLEGEFFANAKEKGLSDNLVNYVWNTLFKTQRGYGFNKSHTLAYSLIGLQELNLCYKYDIVYWNTANLIVDSGANDEDSNEGTNYAKLGIATAKIIHEGITIANPDINEAQFGFIPDENNNQIIYGLKAINSINTEIAQIIIQNRPYKSIEDFAERMIDTKIIKNSQMLMLIKAGCFLNLHNQDRAETMKWYITNYLYKEVDKLTLSQLNAAIEYNIIPKDMQMLVKYINFKKYVLADEGFYEIYVDDTKKIPKCGYHDRYFILDENTQSFFQENFTENSVVRVINGYYLISEKRFTKEIDTVIQPLKDWFISEEAVAKYNKAQFDALWKQYAKGTESTWSMQALTCYDQKHELDNIQNNLYYIVDYYNLPEEPEVYDTYSRYINGELKKIPKYKIVRLAGTVLDADSSKHMLALLTPSGVVTCKYPKGQFAHYNRRLSQIDKETGKKSVVEESWFKRGSLVVLAGIRQNDNFRVMNYTDTIFKHTTERILDIYEDGTLLLQAERAKV